MADQGSCVCGRPRGTLQARAGDVAETDMSMTLDDHDVIVAFRSGDDSVFGSVVAEYRAELLRHAARSAGDAATAEDLVQETFVRAYRAFAKLPDDSRIRPWLHQILRNVCIDDAHRRRREQSKADRAHAQAPSIAFDDGPEGVLGLDHDATALADALADLPVAHRDAFVQRVVVGLEYDEIAAREGVSETNARARVSRARVALRRALQGAAALPVACYLLIRRPGRSAAAVPAAPSGASTATTVAASPTTVDTANRLATSLAPVMETATNVATGSSHTVPLLAKAAVGIGAVATVSLAAGPEQPRDVPPVVTIEAADPLAGPLDVPIITATPVPIAEPAAEPLAPPPAAAPSTSGATTLPPTTTAVTTTLARGTAAGVATLEPVSDPVPGAATTVPTVSEIATTLPATTLPPTTTSPPTTTLPPLAGGSLQASVSVVPSGPRLDLAGPVTITSATTSPGSLTGRIGVGDPDPSGARRIDGTLTVQLDGGTIDLRLAGYGTSGDPVEPGTVALPMVMSGQYRASGDIGRLAPSGSFSATLSNDALSIDLVV